MIDIGSFSSYIQISYIKSELIFFPCITQEIEEKSGWKNHWQDQLSGLKRRSMNRDSGANMSWGARMRRQRDELQDEDV